MKTPLIIVGQEPSFAVMDANLNVLFEVEFLRDAIQIVRAVNSHEQLIEALTAITENTGCCDPDCCEAAIRQDEARDLCRAALARDLAGEVPQ